MSTDSRVPLKLSKKLKFKFAGGNRKTLTSSDSDNRGNGLTRETKSITRDDQQFRGGNPGVEGGRKGHFKAGSDHQRNSKSNVSEKRFRGGSDDVSFRGNFKPVDSDRKRKRVYAGKEYISVEGTSKHHPQRVRSRAPSSNSGEDRLNSVFSKGNNSNSSQRPMWGSSRVKDATTKTRSSSLKFKDKETSVQLHDGKCRTNANGVHKMNFDEIRDGGNVMLNKHAINKPNSVNCLDQSQETHLNTNLKFRSSKKIVSYKKRLDSEVTDERRRKKKKRGIRLDPHDMSNKRLDDNIVISESEKEKSDTLEKTVEMSKNAQFRAIQPSPSILSFVEENLLGRRRLIELRRAGYNINLSAPLDNIPSDETSERMRIEESIFRNKMVFSAAAKVSSSFPPPNLPEVAFAGRSNVGKSSLLNALTRQWGVARTSDKPGLTQSINFFELGSKLCLVDLPGYGFAYAKEEVKDAWEDLVKEYVSTRVGLRQVCILVDTKWGLKPRDHELIELMERSQTKYQVVLTKTDIVFPIDVARRAMQIEESLKAKKSIVQPLMMVSSKSGAGVRSLRTVLAKIAQFAKLKA